MLILRSPLIARAARRGLARSGRPPEDAVDEARRAVHVERRLRARVPGRGERAGRPRLPPGIRQQRRSPVGRSAIRPVPRTARLVLEVDPDGPAGDRMLRPVPSRAGGDARGDGFRRGRGDGHGRRAQGHGVRRVGARFRRVAPRGDPAAARLAARAVHRLSELEALRRAPRRVDAGGLGVPAPLDGRRDVGDGSRGTARAWDLVRT